MVLDQCIKPREDSQQEPDFIQSREFHKQQCCGGFHAESLIDGKRASNGWQSRTAAALGRKGRDCPPAPRRAVCRAEHVKDMAVVVTVRTNSMLRNAKWGLSNSL